MAEVPDDLKASVGQLPDKKYSSNLNDPNQKINLCSIYIENKEYPGLYKTTIYMVDRDTGKTICVPKLSITVPPGNYDLDDDVYNGDSCASKFGTSACIGNIIEDTSKIPGLTPPGGSTLTPETPVSDLIFSNSFECDIATGCKVDAQPPKACADINDSKKTIYEYIIEQAVSAGSISQPGREDINKKPTGFFSAVNPIFPFPFAISANSSIDGVFKAVISKENGSTHLSSGQGVVAFSATDFLGSTCHTYFEAFPASKVSGCIK